MKLAGFGNYPHAEVTLTRARSEADIEECVNTQPSLIARGNGRAYGDAALNPAATLSTLRHDRILDFDAVTGLLTCEAGFLLADLITIFTPRGWFPLVTPGTKYVTIGGMIAADVHGKNHHAAGSMRDCVESLTLLQADGTSIACSATENPNLFAATCGGMGLTGIITQATIRLQKIETAYIRQQTIRTKNLAETMQAFERNAAATYSVAWIDCLSSGAQLGRSVIYLGEHATRSEIICPDNPLTLTQKRSLSIPFYFPSFTLNRVTIRAFNAAYYAAAREGTTLVDVEKFFYPLDAIHGWNKIYGKRGFLQYQCVLPKAASITGLTQLLERIAQAGLGSFLAVLKLLGPGHNYLSFPMEGYTLALDFPATPKVFTLLEELDTIVATHGGRIYLAKDARISAARFAAMYPGLDAFRTLRHQVDPTGKFSSLQSQRLGI